MGNSTLTLDKIFNHTKTVGDCKEWVRCLNTDGYPRAAEKGNSNVKVHRKVFELVNGYLPPVVRHSCDNPKCLNPDHLLAGTPKDNAKDRHDRKRTFNFVHPKTIFEVHSLRKAGKTYKQISEILNMKLKRVEYINLKLGG